MTSERFHDIFLTVNGEEVRERVDARKTLVDFLREDLGLTGSHVGCEHGLCGACTVRVDGAVVRGCLMLAVQCDGQHVDTIEGVADSGEIADLQQSFIERNALQCGYCTPGMLLTAQELLQAGACRAATRSGPISPATTAAAPAIRRSWTRSKRWHGHALKKRLTLMRQWWFRRARLPCKPPADHNPPPNPPPQAGGRRGTLIKAKRTPCKTIPTP